MKLASTIKFLFVMSLCLFVATIGFGQGVTTSAMNGRIADDKGEPLIGANILAVHVPSGTTYGTSTDVDGNYSIPNMRVGGPYRVTVSYTGFSDQVLENLNLRLGENLSKSIVLTESSILLEGVEVIAKSGTAGQNTGTSTQISTKAIEDMPTLDRSLNDFLRLTPQATQLGEGGISFAGTNNRFNAIYIDGAVNNDVFGLAGSGTNGGQTGISPVSIDIIDQFQVVLSPYDVTLGGFAGGGINAVTKSGTNKFQGTAYFFTQNEDLAGKTNQEFVDKLALKERTKLADYTQQTYGFSLGGPIKKDKAFFFANVELQDDETPRPFAFEQYAQTAGRVTTQQLDDLKQSLISKYGYDPGTYLTTSDQLTGLKLFGKLDFNINDRNKLTLRHNYTKAEQFDRNAGSANAINFSNNGIYFPSVTNSSALELNSRFTNKLSNNLIVGFTAVNDDRGSIGNDFPRVIINDVSSGSINFGTEAFSSANQLKQSTLTITDNFKIFQKNHTFTIGTHNEFYDIYNVFIPQNFGTYRFSNINDFVSGAQAIEYDRSYSLVDNITGDGTKAAAEFNAMQLGLYAQDEWSVNKSFTLTYGLRIDLPIITSDPVVDTNFNAVALPKIQAQYDVAKEIQAGQAPDGQLMFSPRVGFQFSPEANRNFTLRGGVGIFTSRIPFVWPGAIFNNNGLTQGFVDERSFPGNRVDFQSDVNKQYVNENFKIPSGDINLFVKDFKYPQVLRTNLAFDYTLPGGVNAVLEGMFTKTLNNVVYTNVNNDLTGAKTMNAVDARPIYARRNIDNTYSAVYVGDNTNEGYSYNVSATLSKDFKFGLSSMLAYTFGDAYSIMDGTSSQNSSQWRGQINIDGRNNPVYGRSDYALGNRIVGNLSYTKPWTADKGIATVLSVFYNGQNDQAFSYIIAGNNARNLANEVGSTGRNRTLVFVPASLDQINLVPYTVSGTTVSVEDQWTRLNSYIESDPTLAARRGDYAEKNGAFGVFNHRFDVALRQDFGKAFGGALNRLQLSVDIFNFANLLNKSWGTQFFLPGDFNNVNLYEFAGYAADGVTPRYNYRGVSSVEEFKNIADRGSRWRMRVGVRYLFN